MARRRTLKSLSVPITMGAVAVPLSVALLVGWTLLLAKNLAENEEITMDVWLLVLGAISFVVIIAVLALLTVFLAREILEVRRQDTFIDSVTHELKSPLASLKLCIETLGRDGLGDKQRGELRQMMLEDVDRLSAFIDDVLQASRIAHTRETAIMSLGEVEVLALVQACAEEVRHRHNVPEDTIVVEVPEALSVTTDRAALEIVVKNLLDNAVKYSSAPARITVLARRRHDGCAELDVADEGIGVPPKHLKRIFNRFYRVDAEVVRKRKGTGLGLFVVSALVRNLGGSVEALSEGKGLGTTIRVVLPAGEGQASTPAPEPS